MKGGTRSMKRFGTKVVFWMAVSVAILVALSSCGGKTTPPGASVIYGSLIVPEGFGGAYRVLQWQEGLTIVLVDDVDGNHESSGSGTTEDPVWRGQGVARAADGREVRWRVETTNGKTATFFIDEQEYDLEQGTLFLIRTTGGQTMVTQHKRDMAGRCFDDNSCQQILKSDPAVMRFIQETINSR
jgi:hypothetical protein